MSAQEQVASIQGEQQSRKKQKQSEVLTQWDRHTDLRPRDIRNRIFQEGDAVMGPCSENEIIEGHILKVEKRGGVWKICVDPYKIGGVPFRGFIRWVEKYWRFIKLEEE